MRRCKLRKPITFFLLNIAASFAGTISVSAQQTPPTNSASEAIQRARALSGTIEVQGTYVGANTQSRIPGEHQFFLTLQQSSADVTATFQSELGGRGTGKGTITDNVIEKMSLQSYTTNCPGSANASLVFSGDTLTWTYSGEDCTGPVEGHGQAKRLNQQQEERLRADCYQEDDQDRTIAGCTLIIQDQSESAEDLARAYQNRGVAYYGKGDYDRAIEDYNKEIRRDPLNATAYYNRGLAFRLKGDNTRATADYAQAITLDPKYETELEPLFRSLAERHRLL